MLSESVYNFAAASRRSTGGGSADQDSDSQQYDSQSGSQLQLAATMQPQAAQQQPQAPSKPRNKRKNFKPISSRMAEVSDESDEREEDAESSGLNEDGRPGEELDYERKPMLLGEERLAAGKQRLNNNEVIPIDLSVATRPPSSDDDSGDSFRHKFILEQLRAQKRYSPGTDVSVVKFAGNGFV